MCLMTMQPRPRNPIEKKKQDVRRYSRNGVISVAAGVGGGLVLFALSSGGTFWLLLGAIIAVVGGVSNWLKVRKIVNESTPGY